tara:strand:- start:410 stop:613 length:204 start_codon:yes stop_codon:yes gene_type:complete
MLIEFHPFFTLFLHCSNKSFFCLLSELTATLFLIATIIVTILFFFLSSFSSAIYYHHQFDYLLPSLV